MNIEIQTNAVPSPFQPGELVTSCDAPEGVLTWVGLVVSRPAPSWADGHMDGRIFVRVLGDALTTCGVFTHYLRERYRLSWVDEPDIRPLTDAEAVAVAEMLVGTPWKDDRCTTHDEEMIGGCVYFRRPRADVRSVLARVSEEGGRVRPWCWASNNAWGCADDMGRIEGGATDIEAGRGRASRALISYTIRSQP